MFARARQQIATLIAPKSAPLAVRRFEAAAGGRRFADDRAFGRWSSETTTAAPTLRSRARPLVANNALAASGLEAWTTALVGAGITATAKHPDAATRAAIDAAVARWAIEAEADGRTDLYGLQAGAVRGMVVDGDSLLVMRHNADGLRLALFPAEQVDESDTRDLPNGGRAIAGIQFDADGRRTAYRFLKGNPSDPFATTFDTVLIDAADVIHLGRPLGAGQVRGTSWFAPVILRLKELDATEDALAVGIKIAALHAGFLTDMNGHGEPFDGDPNDLSLEPGTVRRLPSGYDIKFSTPAQAQQVGEFLSHEIRAVAAGLGVPQHLLDGDLRQANYSSLRAAMVAFRQRVEAIQFATIIPQLVRPVYERAVLSLILSGEIDAPDFETNPRAYLDADFYPPAQPWVDPLKDVQAVRESLAAGLTSRRRAAAELGWSVEDLDAEIAADHERETRLGLNFAADPKPEPEAAK